jgi:flagellar basal-body rod modification protein FlgD
MTVISSLWNHAAAASSPFGGNKPTAAATAADTNTDTSTSDASISANDFLTLLVTEMQNQDPTADTDPNEYVNQLVQVNSLEQLVDINQTLSTAYGNSSSASASHALAGRISAGSAASAAPSASGAAAVTGPSTPDVSSSSIAPQNLKIVSGNLSVPETQPAAQRVAQSLSGRN